ncbi:PREDICTED: retinol dehydrogenase 11-like [Papilio xuthus]|uniref:Retinol dehydrogenase 11 n=1 Tax=Papilio xuthus TaxID=66420 RepID=A0A194Q419_PAPXU|nr:PREDICTED: retinol dehydrogenase 11-like [Papilio xuthus]KPI98155.1 Retinol dehydrogenase 11 [Papilio xuthus]
MWPLLAVFAAVLALAFTVGFYQKKTNAVCSSRRRLDGRTALVTGGTAGMGLRIARDLANRGARVIVACPYPGEGAAAERLLRERSGSEAVVFKHLDLGSLQSVRKFAADLLDSEERLDLLINNAGVGIVGDFVTKDGLNFIMAVNYFGHFLLTLLLMPLLRRSGCAEEPSRIVNTTSVLRHIGRIDLDKLNATDYWFKVQIYGNSKLALVVWARELTARLRSTGAPVVVNSVDPGAVGTAIFDCIGSLKGMVLTLLFRSLFKTPWQGAQTALHVALDDRAGEVSGEVFKNCRAVGGGGVCGPELARRLWQRSAQLVRLDEDELARCLADT